MTETPRPHEIVMEQYECPMCGGDTEVLGDKLHCLECGITGTIVPASTLTIASGERIGAMFNSLPKILPGQAGTIRCNRLLCVRCGGKRPDVPWVSLLCRECSSGKGCPVCGMRLSDCECSEED